MRKFIGWRVALGIFDKEGLLIGLYSAYTKATMPFAKTLACPRGIHVGTKRRFCMTYYTNLTDLKADCAEVLLKLEIHAPDIVKGMEWWDDDAYMGSEAIVTKARVLQWQLIAENGKLSVPTKL